MNNSTPHSNEPPSPAPASSGEHGGSSPPFSEPATTTPATGQPPGSSRASRSAKSAEGLGVIDTLKRMQAGDLSPKLLSIPDRRQIVEYLRLEDRSTAEIALALKCSDRNIERDLRAIRETNALIKDTNMLPLLLGRLRAEVDAAIVRIRRATREPDANAALKVEAELRCIQVLERYLDKLQQFGYLAPAPETSPTNVATGNRNIPTAEELRAEINRLNSLITTPGTAGDSEKKNT